MFVNIIVTESITVKAVIFEVFVLYIIAYCILFQFLKENVICVEINYRRFRAQKWAECWLHARLACINCMIALASGVCMDDLVGL